METLTKQENGLYAILILVLLIPGAIYYAWAFSYLWLWFLVPLGLPAIGVAHAFGLGILKGFMFARLQTQKKDANIKQTFKDFMTYNLFVPTFGLIFGYVVVTWFM